MVGKVVISNEARGRCRIARVEAPESWEACAFETAQA